MLSTVDSIEWQRITDLIKLLGEERFRSGEELGELLTISRAAVWKYIKKIEQLGVKVESIKGKGYKLANRLNLLDEKKIKSLFTGLASREIKELNLFASINSTNSFLMQKDNIKGHVCLAEMQTAGRGRRGREWVSPFAQNIYLSMGWCFESGISAVKGLSLGVGVAITNALREHLSANIQLKWPNDVVVQAEDGAGYQKLAGVLIELRGDLSGLCELIIGIGINYDMDLNATKVIDQPWIDLRKLADDVLPERNLLVASILNHLCNLLVDYEQKTFSFYREQWEALCAHRDRIISVSRGDMLIHAKYFGLTNDGALILLNESGEKLIFDGGEISIRDAQ
jgi:BirA family transcriptional regulator, biotin operon repressor / biotin---[acetyl-CoA-carboxylase] ligase